MKKLTIAPLLIGAFLATCGSGYSPAFAGEPTCGGVAMPPLMRADFDRDMIKATDVFALDGALFKDGKNLCRAVNIECVKSSNECQVAVANMWFPGGHPAILNIVVDPMQIRQWTENGISAAGQIGLCKRRELFVSFDSKKVRLVETSGSGPRCPGGPMVEVLDVPVTD